jgi:hypothetical protein
MPSLIILLSSFLSWFTLLSFVSFVFFVISVSSVSSRSYLSSLSSVMSIAFQFDIVSRNLLIADDWFIWCRQATITVETTERKQQRQWSQWQRFIFINVQNGIDQWTDVHHLIFPDHSRGIQLNQQLATIIVCESRSSDISFDGLPFPFSLGITCGDVWILNVLDWRAWSCDYLIVCLFVWMSSCLFIYLPIWPTASLSVCQATDRIACLPAYPRENTIPSTSASTV